MNASQSGVWDWDLKTGKAFLSDEYYRMFGYEPGEVEGNLDTLLMLVHPDNRKKTLGLLKQQWESGVAATDYEQRFLCKDGSVKWVQIRASILRDAQGKASAWWALPLTSPSARNASAASAVEPPQCGPWQDQRGSGTRNGL